MILDPNGLTTLYRFDFDGIFWSLVDEPGSHLGGLGEKFIVDPRKQLFTVTIDSEQFESPGYNNYYGDYKIEVQGGLSTGGTETYFYDRMLSCTLSLVCVVESLEVGQQEFESAELDLGEELSFKFAKYTQFPNCNYDIDYTLTLIERSSPADQPAFSSQLEGTNTSPPFIWLDEDAGVLRINPVSESLLKKSYAVYINGNVNVNNTI